MRDITERKHAEEALQESEEKYRLLIEHAPSAIYEIDLIGQRFISVNEGACKILGYTEAELMAMSPIDLLGEESKGVFLDRERKALSGEPPADYIEYNTKRKDGSDVWSMLHTRFRYNNGQLVEAFVIAHDITERKKMEEALREAYETLQVQSEELQAESEEFQAQNEELRDAYEALYKSEEKSKHLIKYAPTGIYEIDFTIPKFTSVNDAMCKILGYTREELLALNPFDILDDESQERFRERMRKTLVGEEINTEVEYLVVGKDGQKIWGLLNTHFKYRGDKSVGAVVVAHDITERKKMEEALRQSEEKYRNIVETANEGVWVFNSVSETTYVNEKMAEMLGYGQEEMFGSLIWDYADDEDKGFFQVKLANRKLGIDEVYECKLLRKSGSSLWLLVSANASFDKDGKFAGSLGMFTDITERKKMEEALQKSEEKYRTIVETTNEGIWVSDATGRTTYVNERMARMVGHSREELVGKYGWHFADEETEAISKQNFEKRRQGIDSVHEYKFRRKDGSPLWALVNSQSLTDKNGKFTGVLAMITDITERKQIEAELREAYEKLQGQSEELQVSNEELRVQQDELNEKNALLHDSVTGFRTLADNSPDLIARFDRQNNCLYTNPAIMQMFMAFL